MRCTARPGARGARRQCRHPGRRLDGRSIRRPRSCGGVELPARGLRGVRAGGGSAAEHRSRSPRPPRRLDAYRAAKLRIFADEKPAGPRGVPSDIDVTAALPARDACAANAEQNDEIAWQAPQPDERCRGAVARARGLDPKRSAAALATSLAWRTASRRARDGGVTYVNDSKATNRGAAAAAIGSFDAGVHAILGRIAEGRVVRGLPPGRHRAPLPDRRSRRPDRRCAGGLRRRADPRAATSSGRALAAQRARPGEVVLLRPRAQASTSTAITKQRGEHFKAWCRRLAR